MEQKSNRVLYLDVARVIAIVSISLNHAVNRTYNNYHNIQEEFYAIGFASTVFKAVITVFSQIGVPLFLMLSGILLFNKRMETKSDVQRFYRHNVLDLLITSEIWLFLLYWFVVLLNPVNTIVSYGPGIAVQFCIKTMLFTNQITTGNMWYIPMILCLYLTVPFGAYLLQHFPWNKALLIPVAAVFLVYMCVPTANVYLEQFGFRTLDPSIRNYYLFSGYSLYLLAGWWIGRGGLSRLSTPAVVFTFLAIFALCCGLQIFCYQHNSHLVSYSSPGILLCGMTLLELIRRFSPLLESLRQPISYLAKLCFGIFFLHMVIMELLDWYVDLSGWHRSLHLLFLEAVSVGGSVLVIALLSRIPLLRRRLFLIKD